MAESSGACKEWHKQLHSLLEARTRIAQETQKRLEADKARRIEQLRKDAEAAKIEAHNKLKAAQAQSDTERQRQLQESAKLAQERKRAEQVSVQKMETERLRKLNEAKKAEEMERKEIQEKHRLAV